MFPAATTSARLRSGASSEAPIPPGSNPPGSCPPGVGRSPRARQPALLPDHGGLGCAHPP